MNPWAYFIKYPGPGNHGEFPLILLTTVIHSHIICSKKRNLQLQNPGGKNERLSDNQI
jgi:hypothetical protein